MAETEKATRIPPDVFRNPGKYPDLARQLGLEIPEEKERGVVRETPLERSRWRRWLRETPSGHPSGE